MALSVPRLALLLALSLLPSPAQAQWRASTPALRAEPRLWRDWPDYSWSEGIATVAAGALTGALALRGQPDAARWQGGVLFDDSARDALRLSSPSDRQVARTVGDVAYYSAPLLPLLLDPLVALLVRKDARAALNLELIGWEAFSYAGVLSFVSTEISRRERPDMTECRRQASNGESCEFETDSFWSGHTSIVAASAGLVCANHSYLPLWGHPLADAGACGFAAAAALTTGVSRLLADRHYATDVLTGMGVGFAIGYAVPVLLHYGRPGSGVSFAIQPTPRARGVSLQWSGAF
jgi:membrane-associated phospholipid phosphatase